MLLTSFLYYMIMMGCILSLLFCWMKRPSCLNLCTQAVLFAWIIQYYFSAPPMFSWVSFCWYFLQQILQAVNTIHEERIVHSDLKPANFLLVKGSLKLIDFGIAKAIMSDTTNIQRDSQVVLLFYFFNIFPPPFHLLKNMLHLCCMFLLHHASMELCHLCLLLYMEFLLHC